MHRFRFTLLMALVVMVPLLAGCFTELERGGPATPVNTSPLNQGSNGVIPTAVPGTPVPLPGSTAATGALQLLVRAPVDGSPVPGNAVVVHGLTTAGASLAINGKPTTVALDGSFSAETALISGANQIEVVATDGMDGFERRVLSVISFAPPSQPFLLVVTDPVDQSIVSTGNITVAGFTGPSAVVSINGVFVDVDKSGVFTTAVALDTGPNIVDVVATNNDGRISSVVVAVIYRP